MPVPSFVYLTGKRGYPSENEHSYRNTSIRFISGAPHRSTREVAAHYALTGLAHEFSSLSGTTNDYAFWDRTYEFAARPEKEPRFAEEFQDASMDGLELNLIVVRDLQGKIALAKAYDTNKHKEVPLPAEFLEQLFAQQNLNPELLSRDPLDGLVAFPDAVYVVCIRPILNTQRKREPRGIFLAARKFDDNGAKRTRDLTTWSSLEKTGIADRFPEWRKIAEPRK